jgi:hypothetical protein
LIEGGHRKLLASASVGNHNCDIKRVAPLAT